MTKGPIFDDWYRSIVEPGTDRGWPKVKKRQREVFLRRWFSDFFERYGPRPKDVVEATFVQDQVRLAAANVSIVMPDIERTSELRPTVDVDDYFNSVRITVNGNYTTPSLWAWENPEALAQVAGYLPEQMIDSGLWPLCPQHSQVLIPEVHGDTATWWCRTREHAVARIGELGLLPSS